MTFIAIICAFVGFVFAVKLSLLFQFIVIMMGTLYINSDSVRSMEIGGLFPMIMFVAFIIGLALGDIYYMMAFMPDIGDKIGNAAAWLFKP